MNLQYLQITLNHCLGSVSKSSGLLLCSEFLLEYELYPQGKLRLLPVQRGSARSLWLKGSLRDSFPPVSIKIIPNTSHLIYHLRSCGTIGNGRIWSCFKLMFCQSLASCCAVLQIYFGIFLYIWKHIFILIYGLNLESVIWRWAHSNLEGTVEVTEAP